MDQLTDGPKLAPEPPVPAPKQNNLVKHRSITQIFMY